ncbi:MAG: YqgE/AlgH family protein [Burkholderiales bacterium]
MISLPRAILAFFILLAASGAIAQDASPTLLLVARPGMPDPNFRETVVLITQDENVGAIGVIVNRPTNRSLAELLPGERFRRFTDPVFFGGPVNPNGLFAVFRSDKLPGAAITLLPGLHLALHPDTVDTLIKNPPAAIRFFTGYAGWAPGQLRSELERGDWFIADADADAVFRKDSSNLWHDMVQRVRAVHARAGTLPYSALIED